MTLTAFLGLFVYLGADLGPVGRVDDRPVLAQYPDLFDVLLVPDILDYLAHVSRLILQHGEPRASHDHLGELIDVAGRLLEEFLPAVPHHKYGKQKHRHRQGDRQEKAELELKRYRAHSLLYLSSGSGSEKNFVSCRAMP